MPAKGTVDIELAKEQAETVARWLVKYYKPDEPPLLAQRDWGDRQRNLARDLSGRLNKAARRKRLRAELNLRIPRDLAQWFGTFSRPGGTWVFGAVFLPGQRAPAPIKRVAEIFLKAASQSKGRPRMALGEIRGAKARRDQLVDQKDPNNPYDPEGRVKRRLRERERDLEWEREEILKAGSEQELP